MTKREKEFIKQVQNRIAEISVGSSAIRNQGAPGVIKISRKYFRSIDLKEFRRKLISKHYSGYLDDHTKKLKNKFPPKAKSWGAARKGLNLFFREVAYNHYLAHYLDISTDFDTNLKLLSNLEVPLDKDVATGLIEKYNNLPPWKSIKSLTGDESKKFQEMAKEYARTIQTSRVHLDLEFWRRER